MSHLEVHFIFQREEKPYKQVKRKLSKSRIESAALSQSSLRSISLKGNQLHSLSPSFHPLLKRFFSQPASQKVFSPKLISKGIFSENDRVSLFLSLVLADNPWHCDCHLGDLRRFSLSEYGDDTAKQAFDEAWPEKRPTTTLPQSLTSVRLPSSSEDDFHFFPNLFFSGAESK